MWHNGVLQEDPATGPVHVAIARNAAGEPKAYAVYTLRSDKVAHAARSQEIIVRDVAWLDMDAYRALFEFLSRHDLVGRME